VYVEDDMSDGKHARPDDLNPFHGKPIEILPLPFKLDIGDRMKAAAGLPAWIARRKRLERSLARLRKELDNAWRLATPATWPDVAKAWDLGKFNREIEGFNKYYPIERNLPMDPRIRDFVEGDARWKPLHFFDTAWILAEFPPDGAGRGGSST
jgi:hypothetical protein